MVEGWQNRGEDVRLEDIANKRLRAEILRAITAEDRAAGKTAKLECASGSSAKGDSRPAETGSLPVGKGKALDSCICIRCPVAIKFTHYRVKGSDRDNISTKAAQDALVKAGILEDDSSRQIPERPQECFIEVGSIEEEKTIIEISAAEG